MTTDPTITNDGTTKRSPLRTCLILGAGCAVIGVIGLCILLALGFPIVRNFTQNVDWMQGLEMIDLFSDGLGQTLDSGELPGDIAAELEAALGESLLDVSSDPDVDYQGIRFSYPVGEDYGAVPALMPAELEVDWANQPERVVFTLAGYPLSNTFHEPRLIVMRVADLLAVNSGLEAALDELRGVLEEQPGSITRVPFVMPGFNAAQMITAQVLYLPFVDGQGVRFVTQYGQAAWPINNHDLFYAFQGLTGDGEYLVTAIFPISHSALPDDGESAIGDDYEAFLAGYEDALEATRQMLDQQDPGSFAPSLNALDSMLGSIQIDR